MVQVHLGSPTSQAVNVKAAGSQHGVEITPTRRRGRGLLAGTAGTGWHLLGAADRPWPIAASGYLPPTPRLMIE